MKKGLGLKNLARVEKITSKIGNNSGNMGVALKSLEHYTVQGNSIPVKGQTTSFSSMDRGKTTTAQQYSAN